MYTIISAVQSIMAEKQLSRSFWDEIAAAVVQVKNRCLSKEGETPFKKCNNHLPNVLNLIVLGCRAWVLVPDTISRLTIEL